MNPDAVNIKTHLYGVHSNAAATQKTVFSPWAQNVKWINRNIQRALSDSEHTRGVFTILVRLSNVRCRGELDKKPLICSMLTQVPTSLVNLLEMMA